MTKKPPRLLDNLTVHTQIIILTMGQWMAGFCRAMREESDQNSKEAMLDYLIFSLDDANDFSWTSAKASHAVLLCHW